jgi:YfiH family protein
LSDTPPGWIEATGLPPGVRGGTATRTFPGVSAAPYGPANYSERGGDDPAAVARNRAWLRDQLRLPSEPLWLQQVHGTTVVTADDLIPGLPGDSPCADACVVRGHGVAVVLTADCLPLLLAGPDGVAAVHAGWRGLADGVIEAAVRALGAAPGDIHAWLGPAIGQRAFEVGPEVRAEFVDADPASAECFIPGRGDHWHADLYALARLRLTALGVHAISGGEWCTFDDAAQFHSYRRDGARSGRMATLVWSG